MRSALATVACIGLSVSTGAVPLLAQMQNNTEKQVTCDNGLLQEGFTDISGPQPVLFDA